MWPSDLNLGARHQVNHCPIQTRWLNTRATEFESDNDSLGGGNLSLNWVAASDVNSDVVIQARFSGCGTACAAHQPVRLPQVFAIPPLTKHQPL
ncbi:hypothetical protein PCASD_11546 [Puccinia coronata f. sp. avenae]|uniref:Uncharacterized protein n=1 Tax=Puccinia coronata f. sp. avenae TaxID=200324 RepID=A0A2N5ULV9_9BASI|nr:hypothetical protein PCASD_11546 [Puccinia coronata f. sp. avenae]